MKKIIFMAALSAVTTLVINAQNENKTSKSVSKKTQNEVKADTSQREVISDTLKTEKREKPQN